MQINKLISGIINDTAKIFFNNKTKKMKNILIIFILVCSSISLPRTTLAQLSFFNGTIKTIEIVIKCKEHSFNRSEWTTRGWYKVEAGEYLKIITEPLLNRYIYYYAKTIDGECVWSGDVNVCVSYDKFIYDEGGIFSNTECPEILKFQMIDIGDYTEFTQTLSCKGYELRSHNDYFRPW
jgi:uncharacterized membrane protein